MKGNQKKYIDLKGFFSSNFLFIKNDSDWFSFVLSNNGEYSF